MSRLIDADELLKRVDAEYLSDGFKSYVRTRVKKMPTIDAVPVIRCKECKHYITHDKRCGCRNHGEDPFGWCYKAKRKEE